MTRLKAAAELKDLRERYEMTLDQFAAELSRHLAAARTPTGKGMAVTASKLAKWEKANGPSPNYRKLLVPILQRFREGLQADAHTAPVT